jgi:AraC family transcriptional regulator
MVRGKEGMGALLDRGQTRMHLLTHGQRKYPNSALLVSSADRGWPTIAAELRSHPAGRIASPLQQTVEIVIGICGGDDTFVVRGRAGRQIRWAEGSVWLAPIGVDDEEVAVTAPIPEALHLYLPVRLFDLIAEQYDLTRSPVHSMHYIGGLTDELVRQIGLSILSEMTEETATGHMLAETSSLTLAARLVTRYSDSNAIKSRIDTPHRLDSARLRRILDYIEEHLDEEITLSGLAGLANLSAFHFARMFKAAVGVPPHRYVSRRRLEGAMAMLAGGKLPLCEIAHRSRFSSQASFSRAFRCATGMTPGEYRRLGR